MAYSNIGGYRGWHLQAQVTGVTSDSITVKARIWADTYYSCAWGARTMTMTCAGANNTPQTRSVNAMNNSGNAGSNEVSATFTGLASGTSYTINFSYDVRATLSGSYQGTWTGKLTATTSVPQYWNDINAWNPDKSSQNGLMFDLSTSDGSSWTNLTNEPSGFTKTKGTTATISNIRSNVTGAHYSGNNVTNSTASSFSWTFNTADWACELYTAWDTYSVSYNANGGTGAPGAQTKTYGVNLTLSGTKPTRGNSTANGYTVTFNANGGTASKANQTATNTTSYTFNNWKATNGTSYAPGATYSANEGTTLTAQWNSSTTKGAVTTATASRGNGTATRTVTFNANGGTCSTSSLNSNATITYTMNGWYTAASGGTKRASSGGSYTPTASETVYAQWGSSTGSYSSITLPTPTRSGYIFKGWAESSTATSGVTGSYTPTRSLTLYATWEIDQAVIYYKNSSGTWVKGKVWYKNSSGTWVKAKRFYTKVGGTWKENKTTL